MFPIILLKPAAEWPESIGRYECLCSAREDPGLERIGPLDVSSLKWLCLFIWHIDEGHYANMMVQNKHVQMWYVQELIWYIFLDVNLCSIDWQPGMYHTHHFHPLVLGDYQLTAYKALDQNWWVVKICSDIMVNKQFRRLSIIFKTVWSNRLEWSWTKLTKLILTSVSFHHCLTGKDRPLRHRRCNWKSKRPAMFYQVAQATWEFGPQPGIGYVMIGSRLIRFRLELFVGWVPIRT